MSHQKPAEENKLAAPKGKVLVYQAEEGQVKVDVRLEDETVWLTQQLMAELFQTTRQNISLHVQNIFEEGELLPGATVKEYLTVRREGSWQVQRELEYYRASCKTREQRSASPLWSISELEFRSMEPPCTSFHPDNGLKVGLPLIHPEFCKRLYNLDIIISVGYRVKSAIATRFRIWATQRLKEYIVKGFTMDDARLKEPENSRYFEELLARIRDIRSSKRIFWRKVLDIYATSIDYDPESGQSRLFSAGSKQDALGGAWAYSSRSYLC